MFKAILLEQQGSATSARLADLEDDRLPPGDVDVDVEWSTLNYKDALAITGQGPIVRSWPMVPGIDFAGTVRASRNPGWTPGTRVVLTGWGLGETRWGGLAQRARVEAGWLLALPDTVSTRTAMIFGTAGVTAALCVMALQRHGLQPGDGEVLVTGAAGGVGSVSVALLAALGYAVVASTGRPEEAEYLQALGAARIVDRASLSAPGKPLQRETWAGVVDSVGSHTLVNACAATRVDGAVAACGLAQGADFPATVMPFILRGITLYGINSVYQSNANREAAWALLAGKVTPPQLAAMAFEVPLSAAIARAPEVLAGRTRGRTIVDTSR
ncbi:MAG: oxidoreductase [Pseudomonadota bacterium]|nr:oxidoreductase [Pseudomonadota bacterium]